MTRNKMSLDTAGNKMIIIDGHYFLWRAFSVPFQFHSTKGTPLHTIATYLSLIRRSLRTIENLSANDSFLVVFDSEGDNANSALSPDYKTNRKTFSEDEDCPYKHIPNIKKVLTNLNIAHIAVPGIEADDIIAVIAKKFKYKNNENSIYIVSSDTDFYQLLDDKTFMVKLKPGKEHEIVNTDYVKNRCGISPAEYVYFKSLIGDTADNIKGIRGVGPKTAKKIVKNEIEFDTEQYHGLLTLNRKLITLNDNVEFDINLNDLIFRSKILETKNTDIFESCGF